MEENYVYFELNNWTPGSGYPDEEPYKTWIGDDMNIKFNDEEWVKKNKLCVVRDIIDMSVNFCITAKKSWVDNYCPSLLTRYRDFLAEKDPETGKYYGPLSDDEFLPYTEENIGITDAY